MFGHACVALFARHSGSTEALAGENVTSHVEGSSAVAATRIATIATVSLDTASVEPTVLPAVVAYGKVPARLRLSFKTRNTSMHPNKGIPVILSLKTRRGTTKNPFFHVLTMPMLKPR